MRRPGCDGSMRAEATGREAMDREAIVWLKRRPMPVERGKCLVLVCFLL